jgi:cobalt/nickel transport system ATP-binding protein
MSELADKPVHHLSFGQKKRVCIAGVLAMQPEVLLLDEPMAGLDAAMQVELQALLDRLAGHGITIVLSTHDVDFAYRWADDIHLLAAGRCLASFAAADLRSTRCPAHRRPAAAGRRRIPPRVGRPRAGRQHATAQPGRSARSSHFQGHRMISGCFSRSPVSGADNAR